jgi:hypothetical protein
VDVAVAVDVGVGVYVAAGPPGGRRNRSPAGRLMGDSCLLPVAGVLVSVALGVLVVDAVEVLVVVAVALLVVAVNGMPVVPASRSAFLPARLDPAISGATRGSATGLVAAVADVCASADEAGRMPDMYSGPVPTRSNAAAMSGRRQKDACMCFLHFI